MSIRRGAFFRRSVWVLILAVMSVMPGSALGATNLIQNADLETVNQGDSTLPAQWQRGYTSSESASTYAYPTVGTDGDKAVHTEIDNATYVSGDAKWVFDDVTVEAGKKYIYSDYFKTNASSNVLVRFNGGSNCPTIDTLTVCYMQIGTGGPSVDWTQFKTLFTMPAGVETATVFRVITGTSGEATTWLDIDDVQLELDTPATIVDNVPNNSLEEIAYTGLPKEWMTGSYGDNTSNFEYPNDGHDGTRSAKVTVSNYVSGDAKWFFTPQSVTPGKDYLFTGWYKVGKNNPGDTLAIPHVVAQYTKANGDIAYFGMPRPEPAQENVWQEYTNEFSIPNDVVSVTVFFYLAGNGWVQTDDFHITPYQYRGLHRPLVTLTFDDGFEENVTTALPILTDLGLKTTQCYNTGVIEGIPTQEALVKEFTLAGHEVCSHSVTHTDLTTLPLSGDESTPGTLRYELAHSKKYLENLTGVSVPNFASPYGAYSAEVNNVIRDYYSSHRTVDEGYNSKDNFNLYRLKVQNINKNTTLAEFQEWVRKAKEDDLWLIVVYHKVTEVGVPQEQYDIDKVKFTEQMSWLVSAGVTVKKYNDALAEIQDTTPPVVTLLYSTTLPTTGDVVVTAQTNEGTLNTTTHTFTSNGTFNFVATDDSGNETIEKAKVTNIDKEAPTIGATSNSTEEATAATGAVVTYVLPSSTDPIVCSPTSGSTFALGITTVDCLATDAAGNTRSASFEITVVDTTAPEIVLVGSNPQAIELGEPYVEQGATASDIVGGNLSSSISIDTSLVNTNVAGTYTVTYNVTDTAGNHAVTKTRTIQVASRTITVTADAQTKTFGQADPVLTYSLTSGSLLPSDSFTGTLARTTGEGLGVYPIAVGTLAVSPSYAINFISSSLTILPPVCTSGTVLKDTVCVKKSTGSGGGSKKKSTSLPVAKPLSLVLGEATTTQDTAPRFIFTQPLFFGLRSDEVTELQKRLTSEGVYTGPITGYFGPLTKAGVIRFQAKNNLPQLGMVGPLTRAVLNK